MLITHIQGGSKRERERKRSHTENPLAAGSKLQIVWGGKKGNAMMAVRNGEQ